MKKILVYLSSIIVMVLLLAALPMLPGSGVAVAANEDWTTTSMPGVYSIIDIEAADYATGWAIGATSSGGVILHTFNDGASWETQMTVPSNGMTRPLTAISVVNTEIAWASGYGSLYKTTDSGTTWETVFSSANYDMAPDICAVDANNAWAILFDPTQQASCIFKTSNGGATWVKLYSQPFSSGALMSISAVDNATAWAAGSGFMGYTLPETYSGTIVKTSDMGATWQKQTPAGNKNFHKVQALDASNAWVSGDGVVMNTTNGGTTWNTSYSEPGTQFWGLSAGSGNTVWAAGSFGYSGGCVVKSVDQGNSWEKLFEYHGAEYGFLNCLETFSSVDACAGIANSSYLINNTPNSGSYVLRTANGGSARPDINYVSPSVAENGDTIIIDGADFGAVQSTSKVFFGGTEPASYEMWSDDTLKVTIPADIHGKCQVTVVTAAGVSNAVDMKVAAPVTITSVEPGLVTQLMMFAQIKITGSGFQPGAMLTFVSFNYGTNRTYAANVVSDSEITLTVNLFDLGIGAHDVSVTNPDGGHAYLPLSFTVMGGCGTGAGPAAVALGGMLGMLSVGRGIRRRRRRRRH